MERSQRNKGMLAFIAFKAMIDWTFVSYSAVSYRFGGLILSFSLYKYIISWIVCLLFMGYVVKAFESGYSAIVAKSLFLFSGLPNLSLYGLLKINSLAYCLMILYWALILAMLGASAKKEQTLPKETGAENAILPSFDLSLILLIVGGIFTVYYYIRYGAGTVLISFDRVYDYRWAYAAMSRTAVSRYLINWLGIIINPYCFTTFLINKKTVPLILSGICGLLLYSIGAEKSVLLIYPFIVIIHILYKRKDMGRFFRLLCWGGVAYGVIGMIAYLAFDNLKIQSIFQRVFIMPPQINYLYYDFFSSNELLLLRESIFRWIDSSPYQPYSKYIIGAMTQGGGANTGLFGDAYSNFGVVGVFVYPFLTVFAFRLLKRAFKNLDSRLAAVMTIRLVAGCLSVSFFTWLLTGGVALCMVIVTLDRLCFKHPPLEDTPASGLPGKIKPAIRPMDRREVSR